MQHVGSIEAKYTTNKSILPKTLVDAMRESFKKSEYLLDLEKDDENPIEKKKENVKENVERLTPEQLDRVQEFVRSLADCNTLSGKGS